MANRKVPLGSPLALTDEQLEELSVVTPLDITKAQALWRAVTPVEFQDLLDAKEIDDDNSDPAQ
jgi:hypothetical protein